MKKVEKRERVSVRERKNNSQSDGRDPDHINMSAPQHGVSSKRSDTSHRLRLLHATKPPASNIIITKKAQKRQTACKQCAACIREDCGKCDHCLDMRKFGGKNTKKQKCRLRVCEEANRRKWLRRAEEVGWRETHLPQPKEEDFPLELGEDGGLVEEWRRREEMGMVCAGMLGVKVCVEGGMSFYDMEVELPEFYSHDTTPLHTNDVTEVTRRKKGQKVTDDVASEDLRYEHPLSPGWLDMVEGGVTCQEVGVGGLLSMLRALTRAVLPVHWVSVLAAGPLIQLLQCSKYSTMADTIIHLQPSCHYHVTVQGLPLLPTHTLYHTHPERLTHLRQVVSLLCDLENLAVCRGWSVPSCGPPPADRPFLLVRSATCLLLVPPTSERCPVCQEGWEEVQEEVQEEEEERGRKREA